MVSSRKNNRKHGGVTKKNRTNDKTKSQKNLLEDFSHLFVTYINQIFGDRTMRTLIYEEFGKKSYNKHLRFGLVAFHRYEDPSDEWVEANDKDSVSKKEASYYDNKTDQVTLEDSDDNHHVLYDVKHKRYVDSVNTEGMKYQDQERDENDSLCQSYTLMFFFNFEMDNDPIQKQMQIIGMYEWLLNQKTFLNKVNKELFYKKNKDNEHWIDEDGHILPTQNKTDFQYLIHRIKDTLKLWEKYGYWHFIGKGDKMNVKYDMDDYGLEGDSDYEDSDESESEDEEED